MASSLKVIGEWCGSGTSVQGLERVEFVLGGIGYPLEILGLSDLGVGEARDHELLESGQRLGPRGAQDPRPRRIVGHSRLLKTYSKQIISPRLY
jgi:hypothetical protein